jgi:hypothetical protein
LGEGGAKEKGEVADKRREKRDERRKIEEGRWKKNCKGSEDPSKGRPAGRPPSGNPVGRIRPTSIQYQFFDRQPAT